MAKKPVILLTLCESLSNTVVVSQVLGHARVMAEAGVGTFHIVALAWNATMQAESERFRREAEKIADAPIRIVRGVRPAIPGSDHVNGRLVAQGAKDFGVRFTHVHARTDYSVLVSARSASTFDSVLIWDCRGDSVAELDFRKAGPARWMARRAIESRLATAARRADRALFVSRALRRRMIKIWPESKPTEIIPSAASERLFFFDPDLRRDTRRELGLNSQTPLYVYSGGLAPYQKVPEMVRLFQRIKHESADAKFLILTADAATASALTRGIEGVEVRSVANAEVNRYLNAADAAFMLRDSVATNAVASPTKFAEYSLAGLPVVMTNAVADSYALARECGNLVEVVNASVPGSIPEVDRAAVAEFYRCRLGREAAIEAYRRLYA